MSTKLPRKRGLPHLWFGMLLVLRVGIFQPALADDILIPMDGSQQNHLKAYGFVFWVLEQEDEVDWLLNYRGGSFLLSSLALYEQELRVRGVSFERISGADAGRIAYEVQEGEGNTNLIKLEKAPKIAVYAPEQTLPWDDAVLLALNYAEVPYDMLYDQEILDGELANYDWLHLHHEDFTGQYGKFFTFRNTPWYIEQQREAERLARELGFRKVSALKAEVTQTIRDYVGRGGFLFAMCSGTDTIDLALAARATDIVPEEYDGDPVDPSALTRLEYDLTFAFTDFTPIFNPAEYEHSDIDVGPPPPAFRDPSVDYFTLFEFSARWDPVPTMLTQNHVATVKGFVGQTTAFRKSLIKPGVVMLAESPGREEVKYLTGIFGQGTFTFYAGHDPEDYQHFVGDPATDLDLYRSSPGYRLILNNILFPAARKQKQKT
jgi:hypothetical protein